MWVRYFKIWEETLTMVKFPMGRHHSSLLGHPHPGFQLNQMFVGQLNKALLGAGGSEEWGEEEVCAEDTLAYPCTLARVSAATLSPVYLSDQACSYTPLDPLFSHNQVLAYSSSSL
jgi:hypothetical protein